MLALHVEMDLVLNETGEVGVLGIGMREACTWITVLTLSESESSASEALAECVCVKVDSRSESKNVPDGIGALGKQKEESIVEKLSLRWRCFFSPSLLVVGTLRVARTQIRLVTIVVSVLVETWMGTRFKSG